MSLVFFAVIVSVPLREFISKDLEAVCMAGANLYQKPRGKEAEVSLYQNITTILYTRHQQKEVLLKVSFYIVFFSYYLKNFSDAIPSKTAACGTMWPKSN